MFAAQKRGYWSRNNKGTAANDHFARGHWGEFLDKHLIIKTARVRRQVKITTPFEVAILCALSDAQCKTREWANPNLNVNQCTSCTWLNEAVWLMLSQLFLYSTYETKPGRELNL